MNAEDIIKKLDLKPHPEEGGFYSEIYRSDETIGSEALPSRYGAARNFGTSIYYMLTPETFSMMHILKSDEIFHFYLGDPLEMLQLYPDGTSGIFRLGPDILNGDRLQVVVPRGVWQGMRLVKGGKFGLVGTTVAPGFEYADYSCGKRDELIKKYGGRRELITALTRG